jgi:4-amino-4-deoxy-L-arabinose transferase-like glycosyltransferase
MATRARTRDSEARTTERDPRLRIAATLAVGLALIAIALFATLSRTAPRRTGTNDVTADAVFGVTHGSSTICQPHELIPAGTGAIRVSLAGDGGAPAAGVVVTAGARTVARGHAPATAGAGSLTVPLQSVVRQDAEGRVCVQLGSGRLTVRGHVTSSPFGASRGSTRLAGRLRFDYLRPGRKSGWALASTVFDRMGIAHALGGSAAPWLALLLVLGAIALGAWQLLAGRLPRAVWVCALVAVLNATAWSLITPAFDIPDEQSHYAYTEYLVHHGQPPRKSPLDLHSTSEEVVLRALRFNASRYRHSNPTIWSATEQRRLDLALAGDATRSDGNGAAREVAGEPPLFYALQAIPYELGSGGDVLDRLALMRLLSVLLAGVTVVFVYLFLREALPANPWTWTVGALGVAFQPTFGFISGGMNSDALLYAAAAALFYLLARAFRRGLTQRLALAIGGALAVALMTKFNGYSLLPGAAVALVVLAARQEPRLQFQTLRLPALALAVALAPALIELLLNATAWHRPLLGASASNYNVSGLRPSLEGGFSYLWQFYLFALPGMKHIYKESLPLRTEWVDGFISSYGWADTEFRGWVYDVALIPIAAIVALCVRELTQVRAVVRERRPELLSYGVVTFGVLMFVALASYVIYLRFTQVLALPRYLFPLLPLYAALLVLAARGAGRRWLPVAGSAIVVVTIAHSLFSQLLVIARYYA